MGIHKVGILFGAFIAVCSLKAQPFVDDHKLIEVVGLSDTINYQFIQNQDLYSEGWDKLAQPNFWISFMLCQYQPST